MSSHELSSMSTFFNAFWNELTEGLHFTSSGKLFHIIDPQNVIDLFPCSVFTLGRTKVLVSFCLVP